MPFLSPIVPSTLRSISARRTSERRGSFRSSKRPCSTPESGLGRSGSRQRSAVLSTSILHARPSFTPASLAIRSQSTTSAQVIRACPTSKAAARCAEDRLVFHRHDRYGFRHQFRHAAYHRHGKDAEAEDHCRGRGGAGTGRLSDGTRRRLWSGLAVAKPMPAAEFIAYCRKAKLPA